MFSKNFWRNSFYLIGLYFIVDIINPLKAQAYLDPGTGSMVLQMIAACIVGLGCSVKIWGAKLLSLFKKKKDVE